MGEQRQTKRQIVQLTLSICAMVLLGLLLVIGMIVVTGVLSGANNTGPTSRILVSAIFALLVISVTVCSFYLLHKLRESLGDQLVKTEDFERERLLLEKRIIEQKRNLDRWLVQLRMASEITDTISKQVDIFKTLPEICELIKERFELYFVGVFLLSDLEAPGDKPTAINGQAGDYYAMLTAGTGKAGREMLASGYRLPVGGDSTIGTAVANRQTRMTLVVPTDDLRFKVSHLPDTRSELAIPILTYNQTLGAVTCQSDKDDAFDANDIFVLQSITESLGSAIEKRRLTQALGEKVDEIETLQGQNLDRAWKEGLGGGSEIAYTYQAPYTGTHTGNERTIEIPLMLRNQVIGNLILEADAKTDTPENPWSEEELALAKAVADQAALALENARLLQEAQRLAAREVQINWIGTQLRSSGDIENILQSTVRELGSTLGADRTFIQLGSKEKVPIDEKDDGPTIVTKFIFTGVRHCPAGSGGDLNSRD